MMQWVDEVRNRFIHRGERGENLRHDDAFIQLKNENVAVSPNADWMMKNASDLLLKSPDLRVCMYSLNAAALLGDLEQFAQILRLYADLIAEKYESIYPEGDRQKLSTFEWCSKSFIHHLLKDKIPSIEQADQIRASLETIHQVFALKTGEIIKWRSLSEWLGTQVTHEKIPEQPVDPTQSVLEVIQPSTHTRAPVEEYIRSLINEEQYGKATMLGRALKWSDMKMPEHLDGKTRLQIRQSALADIRSYVDAGSWKEVLNLGEKLFLESGAHFCFTLSHWSYQALNHLGFTRAAESILDFLKKLYKNDGQMFSLMYNEGQLFCEPETLIWLEQASQDRSEAAVTDPNNAMQLIHEQDVDKMKIWINEHPIKTKIDAYLHDLIYLKLTMKNRSVVPLVCASEALFERSIDENLYAWNPELARSIWSFYAGILKEEKQKNNNNNDKPLWQAQWDKFTSLVARTHVPAALEIMK